jgi:hypothetical protein
MDREVRPLDEILELFVQSYNLKYQLSNIFRFLPMTISLQIATRTYTITFTNESAAFIEGTHHERSPVVEFVGQEMVIRELLLGKQKLRNLISHQELTVKGSFRNILLLESVFYLSNKGFESKIKSENLVNVN